MKLTIDLTPEMRIRLMHAETVEIDVPDDVLLENMANTKAHPDDAAIDRFATAMKEKMAADRAKGLRGWDSEDACSDLYLARSLVTHLFKGNTGTFECVANFAMMLHQRKADPVVLQFAASSDLPVLTGTELIALKEIVQSRNAGAPCYIDQDLMKELSMKGALHYSSGSGYEVSTAGWAMLSAAKKAPGSAI